MVYNQTMFEISLFGILSTSPVFTYTIVSSWKYFLLLKILVQKRRSVMAWISMDFIWRIYDLEQQLGKRPYVSISPVHREQKLIILNNVPQVFSTIS